MTIEEIVEEAIKRARGPYLKSLPLGTHDEVAREAVRLTLEECAKAVCVQCGRDIEVEMHEGFWRHVYMSGQTGRCLADPIRAILNNGAQHGQR